MVEYEWHQEHEMTGASTNWMICAEITLVLHRIQPGLCTSCGTRGVEGL